MYNLDVFDNLPEPLRTDLLCLLLEEVGGNIHHCRGVVMVDSGKAIQEYKNLANDIRAKILVRANTACTGLATPSAMEGWRKTPTSNANRWADTPERKT